MAEPAKDKFAVADDKFQQQVSQQVQRATAELNRLEQLLKAGMVDREALTEFRESVNRVRVTGWAVQQALDPASKHDAAVFLTIERVRCAIQLTTQLTADLQLSNINESIERRSLEALDKSLQTLGAAVHDLLTDDPLQLNKLARISDPFPAELGSLARHGVFLKT